MQFSWLNKDHNNEKGKVILNPANSNAVTTLAMNKMTGRNVLVDGESDQSQS